MSYQSIETNLTERFFTLIGKSTGDPIINGTVNYYLKAKSGTDDGKWWRESDQTWQKIEIANPMSHEADGHWEIDFTTSPFTSNGVRFLEYIKESDNLHVPDSRHLIARDELVQPDNAGIAAILAVVQASECDTEAIIDAMLIALAGVEIRPEVKVLGPCQTEVKQLDLC